MGNMYEKNIDICVLHKLKPGPGWLNDLDSWIT
jgi:hypothetical protein